jgi:hypothetical protein
MSNEKRARQQRCTSSEHRSRSDAAIESPIGGRINPGSEVAVMDDARMLQYVGLDCFGRVAD